MKIGDLKTRIDQLIALSDAVLATEQTRPTQSRNGYVMPASAWVSNEGFQEFRSASISFINRVFGAEHTFHTDFLHRVKSNNPGDVTSGRGILRAVKQEIDGGWLFSLKGLVSAEIFGDFLEMAQYLLSEGYKDPAAVMIGGVLEEHLRNLCVKNGIPPFVLKGDKEVAKKADTMNNELAAAGVYGKLEQKNVVAWLDLRNKAAHGLYTEFRKEQVETMDAGVTDFIIRVS